MFVSLIIHSVTFPFAYIYIFIRLLDRHEIND